MPNPDEFRMRNETPSPRPVAIIANGLMHPWPLTDESKLVRAIGSLTSIHPTYTFVYIPPLIEGTHS